MGAETKIEWCTHTFNPWWGCSKISLGCTNCYAEALDKRTGGGHWGPKADRRRTGPDNWKQPLRWNRKAAAEGTRPRVFCASMADVFDDHPSILPEWREDLWALIEATPHLDWLLLTKRPANIMAMIPERWRNRLPDHVAVGATVINQAEADTLIDALTAVPARVRFLSIEPLLGPVDLSKIYVWRECNIPELGGAGYEFIPALRLLHWVIVGGESGPGARPMHPDWVCSISAQCARAGIAFFFKQWGEFLPEVIGREDPRSIKYPPDHVIYHRIGKARAGRKLYGVTHDAFPDTRHG